MAIFNCKSCGGDLDIQDGTTVVTCEYCGRQQTVPSADNEKKVNLFNRANRLRSKCDFDKAASVYESIVAEFPTESEAYWGLCLCKFGIEYVDDPATANKIPTCHRTSYESIFDDSNFDLACENADALAVNVYRSEAKEIDRLQKEILEIANNEKPFDVFICYKESDDMGGRTVDSELAHDIYDVLTEKGYKVFYSRITLKSKLGQDYEPYIFSALNSAKVMLSIGTKFEYFNAVWVKNEWSRFLALMKNDKSKMLIPCYRDIDPYDMPKEFSNLQGQDLSSPRAFQDLVTNIEKIIPKNSNTRVQNTQQPAVISASPAVEPLLKRALISLEDEDWAGADKCCEKILDIDPENAQTYLVKLLIECKLNKEELLGETTLDFKASNNYAKIMRFGSEELKGRMNGYCNTQFYNETVKLMEKAKTRGEYEEVKKRFLSLGNFLEAPQKIKECDEIIAKFPGYDKAVKLMGSEKIKDLLKAGDMFLALGDYFDSQDKAKECQRIYEENAEPIYRKAVMALECSSDLTDLRNAKENLLGLGDYRDAAQKAADCQARISELEEGHKGSTNRAQNEPKKIPPKNSAAVDSATHSSTISADSLAIISKPLESDKKSDSENKKNHRGTVIAIILAVISIAAIFIIVAVNKKTEDDIQPKHTAAQWGEAIMSAGIEMGFYDMEVVDTAYDIQRCFNINVENCEDYYFAINSESLPFQNEIVIASPKIGKESALKSELDNRFYSIKNSMDEQGGIIPIAEVVSGTSPDGYYYIIVHQCGNRIASDVFGASPDRVTSASVSEAPPSPKYDLSMINTILNTTVGELMSQSTNVEDSYFGYSMTYKGYDITVMADKYVAENILNGYPAGLEFPIEMLVPGNSSYTIDELTEIFGDKMKVDYVYDDYYDTQGYQVTVELDYPIVFMNGTGSGLQNENFTDPFSWCVLNT